MPDFQDREPLALPPRLNFAARLGELLRGKIAEAVAGLDDSYTQAQKDFMSTCLHYDPVGMPEVPLSLLEADGFGISSVGAMDSDINYNDDHVGKEYDDPGNYAVTVFLNRDSSPFVYDDDLDDYPDSQGYVVLAGPDGPPVMIHRERLEDTALADPDFRMWEDEGGLGYYQGRWRDMSVMAREVGSQFLHLLSDKDCEHVLTAVGATEVNTARLVSSMSAVPGFSDI